MKKSSLSALVAAGLLMGGLSAGSASAADLGGNCCADLEERIAELEATTARKGNRKVSLTISGWVGEQVMYWDDGSRAEHLRDGPRLDARFALQVHRPGHDLSWLVGGLRDPRRSDGQRLAHSQPVLAAQCRLHLGDFGAYAVQLLQSYWFIKSDHLGKLGVGLQSSASDNAAILVDGSGSLVPANWVMFDYNGFLLRNSTSNTISALNWQTVGGFCFGGGGAGGDCFGAPRELDPLQLADLRRVLGLGLLG